MTPTRFQQLANFIWSVADLLRGPYRPPQYERVMLPLTVLRRFDAVLAPSKEAVLKRHAELSSKGIANIDAVLNNLAKDEDGRPLGFHNHSQLDFPKLKGDPDNIGRHLADYINGFSENIRKIFERFEFEKEIEKLEESNRLYQVVAQFAEIDLHPRKVDNITMGLVFEDLIRRFNEAANETAGDHFTPREVIQLMVNLLLEPDTRVLTQAGVIVTVCDPACGTGGMLAEAQNWIRAHNDQATVKVFGQDYNPRSYAVAASDLLIKGHKDGQVVLGNTLTDDPFPNQRFDYLLANPPFGVDWKAEKKAIDRWPNFRGYGGKLPRINDGALLFLLYMMSKFQDYKAGGRNKPGSRTAIVFNGSPLFSGAAGSGESEIRRWIIENDWLEAIVALPDQLFYNTAISTYFWVLTNRKRPERRGKVQLIDARDQWVKMRKSLGDKRKEISPDQIAQITRLYAEFTEGERVKILPNESFGFQRITVERPLRLRWEVTAATAERLSATKQWAKLTPDQQHDLTAKLSELVGVSTTERSVMATKLGPLPKAIEKQVWDAFAVADPEAPVVSNRKGESEPDSDLRDNENVPLPAIPVTWTADPTERLASIEYRSAVEDYMAAEVLPYVADAWVDHTKTKIGYEIPLTRHFYKYAPPRPLTEIDAEIKALEAEIQELLREVTE